MSTHTHTYIYIYIPIYIEYFVVSQLISVTRNTRDASSWDRNPADNITPKSPAAPKRAGNLTYMY